MLGSRGNRSTHLLLFPPTDCASSETLSEKQNYKSISSTPETRLPLEIDQAIRNNELFLLYQPIWSVREDCFVGSEALVRWQSPHRGLVMPNDFIPSVEKVLRTTLKLGDWVAKKALEQASSWAAGNGTSVWRQAINVSARELEQDDFPYRLRRILKKVGFEPTNTELEITERWELEDFDKAVHILKSLRSFGFKISIDDFGTGFSSLACLGRLPIDRVKIARELVQDCTQNSRSAVVAKNIISMAQELSVEVLAEGIETQEEFDLFKSMGCTEFQGYFFGRPMAHADLAKAI